MDNIMRERFASACLHAHGQTRQQGEDWTPHPKCPGVRLKTLVAGADTEGRLSCHLVAVDPGKALALHEHAGQWELHQVIGGSAKADLDGREVDYAPGTLGLAPMGSPHSITASDQGLTLLAVFFPALA